MAIFSRRVFLFGTGRSGLVGKAFAVRLAHLKGACECDIIRSNAFAECCFSLS